MCLKGDKENNSSIGVDQAGIFAQILNINKTKVESVQLEKTLECINF